MRRRKQPRSGLRITLPDEKQLRKVEHLLETGRMQTMLSPYQRAEQMINLTSELFLRERTEALNETQTVL